MRDMQMKICWLLAMPAVLAAGIFALAPKPVAEAALLDAIVATVDTEVILYSELLSEVREELEKIQRSAGSDAEYEAESEKLLKAALDQAIETKLLYREAQIIGIEVTDEEVEVQVEGLRDLFDSNEAFMRELERADETLSDFRTRVRKRIMAQRLAYSRMKQYEAEEVVAEEQIIRYYEDNVEAFGRPERVHVSQIFLRKGRTDASESAAREKIAALRQEIAGGADFAELARQYSEAPGADAGGTIGWQKRGDLVAALDEAAFALQAGDLSGVIETRRGFHLLRVNERETAGALPLNEVRAQIEPMLRAEAAEKKLRKWIAELRERSAVRVFL